MSLLVREIPKHLSSLSVILIFIGYSHLHSFYCSQFNIEIYQYITTGEIILSFLPIAFKLLAFAVFLGLLVMVLPSDEGGQEEKRSPKVYKIPFTKYEFSLGKDHSVKALWRYYSNKKKRLTFKQIAFLFLKIVIHMEFIWFVILIIATYWVWTTQRSDGFVVMLFWGIWLALFFFLWMKRKFSLIIGKFFKENYKVIYWAGTFVFGFVFLDYINMYYKAEDIKQGKNYIAVKFEYEKGEVDTFVDTTLSYIGSTQQYLFVYDTKRKSNQLYEKSKAINIVIGERRYMSKVKADSLRVRAK